MRTFATVCGGQLPFGSKHEGSRVVAYTATAEENGGGSIKLQSISAMSIYKHKSHEELRWEDYQSGDKGGPYRVGQSAGRIGSDGSAIQSNSIVASPTFSPPSFNPFDLSTTSNQFAPWPS
ncbi:hypothetical protein U1Q18_002767 [Sarracenia purpurea var. burkii]